MKTAELTGAALDWAVAKCEGFKPGLVFGKGAVNALGFWAPSQQGGQQGYVLRHDYEAMIQKCDGFPWTQSSLLWSPSEKWAQGGPIIDREHYDFTWLPKTQEYCSYHRQHHVDNHVIDCGFGPTMLIAAMRCYVASKLGDEVEVPKELL